MRKHYKSISMKIICEEPELDNIKYYHILKAVG